MDTEMQGIPDDFDLSEFCDWDLPPQYYQFPVDFQSEPESWKFKTTFEMNQEGGMIPTPMLQTTGQDVSLLSSSTLGSGLHHIPEESEHESTANTSSIKHTPTPESRSHDKESSSGFRSNPETQHDPVLIAGGGSPGVDFRTMDQSSSVQIRNPHVNLVFSNNVVYLDSRCCPKPDVTVLQSQVISRPNSNTPCLQGGNFLSSSDQEVISRSIHEGYMEPIGFQSNQTECGIDTSSRYFHFGTNQQMTAGYGTHHQEQVQQSVDYMDTDGQQQQQFLGGNYDPMESMTDKETNEDYIMRSTTAETTDFLNLDQTAEAEICAFVKSVAPQLQNLAFEEIINETNFKQRLKQAEMKMTEQEQEVERIRHKMTVGEIMNHVGQQQIQDAYDRREAAASELRREQDLMQGAIKRRTLEKICNWMREHLLGNSSNRRDSTNNRTVRRSFSEGSRRRSG
eukprot:g511.t1